MSESKRTIRFPFDAPYGYLEEEYDPGMFSSASEEDDYLASVARAAVAAENAMVTNGGGIRTRASNPLVNEAMQRGAVPAPQAGVEACPQCGSPGKWETTKTGKSVLKCTGACKDTVGGRSYAHTIRWGD